MDFAELGRIAAQYNKNLPIPAEWRGYVADAIDAVTPIVGKVEEVIKGVDAFAEAFVKAHEPEGWAGIVDEPSGYGDYHCESCFVQDAPVEEISPNQMIDYILKHGSEESIKLVKAVGVDNLRLNALNFLKDMFEHNRNENGSQS